MIDLRPAGKGVAGRWYASDAGIRREAAVNGENHAGDEGSGVVIQQEQNCADQLLCFAETPHRGCGENLAGARRGRAVRVPEERRVLLRREKARRDSVDADADFGKMYSEPLRKVGDGRLCARIRRDFGQRRVNLLNILFS